MDTLVATKNLAIISEIKHNKEVGERYMTLGDIIDIKKEESFETGKLISAIQMCRTLDKTDVEIVDLLMSEYSLTKDDAIKLVTNN